MNRSDKDWIRWNYSEIFWCVVFIYRGLWWGVFKGT